MSARLKEKKEKAEEEKQIKLKQQTLHEVNNYKELYDSMKTQLN